MAGAGDLRSLSGLRMMRGEVLAWAPENGTGQGSSWRTSRSGSEPRSPLFLLAIAAVAALIVLWTVLVFAIEGMHFVLLTPGAHTVVEAASALSRFFGALVLLLFPDSRLRSRLRWVAGGFIVLGLGDLFFRFVWPPLFGAVTPGQSMYAAIVVWSTAGLMFVVALLPFRIGEHARRLAVGIAIAGLGLTALGLAALNALPELVTTSTALVELKSDTPLRGLTGWHWVLSSIPLALALLATAGAVVYYLRAELGAWLVIAMMLLAGSQLHNLFWPSAYIPILTTAGVLRLLFAAVVVIGGVVELRRVALEREELLAVEQEYSARLRELATHRNNFTAMVAHELHSPLAALRGLSTMISSPALVPQQRVQASEAIQQQIDLLTTLVNDVQDMAAVERSSFDVNLRPVQLRDILLELEVYGQTLPGQHALQINAPADVRVQADPERIGQVLQNLLNNAAKYSPEGTPIEVRAAEHAGRVRIEVADEGFGIAEDDMQRIFECFGRGSDPRTSTIPGTGLGLYLSQRIVQAHGGELGVSSRLGVGSVFSFELGRAP